LAATKIGRVKEALTRGFRAKGAEVEVWANKSDYKDFIRMYVVSDYFKGISDKERADTIYSVLEASAARDSVKKISLCIGMTRREYERDFGAGTWIRMPGETRRAIKSRPRTQRLAKVGSRN